VASQQRAAVLGRPIAHSLSPVLHRAAYAALGLDWSYDAIDCGVAELEGVLAERTDWAGFSCTMPLKHAALDVADEVRHVAMQVGAANTLLPAPSGGWIADNTDVAGVRGALAEAPGSWSDATVLGAGGTAQAAVVALSQSGVVVVDLLVRDTARTEAVRETADRAGLALRVGNLAAGSPALSAGLVVSALPPGAADALAHRSWGAGQTVLDVVYDRWPTPLAAAAAGAGACVLSGALMLLHQAAAQVQRMTGQDAPIEAMRSALRAAVPNAGL
jgi:shikimate dehydrogenase